MVNCILGKVLKKKRTNASLSPKVRKIFVSFFLWPWLSPASSPPTLRVSSLQGALSLQPLLPQCQTPQKYVIQSRNQELIVCEVRHKLAIAQRFRGQVGGEGKEKDKVDSGTCLNSLHPIAYFTLSARGFSFIVSFLVFFVLYA